MFCFKNKYKRGIEKLTEYKMYNLTHIQTKVILELYFTTANLTRYNH